MGFFLWGGGGLRCCLQSGLSLYVNRRFLFVSSVFLLEFSYAFPEQMSYVDFFSFVWSGVV